MPQGDNPVVQQLEEQMKRIQERLRRPQRSGGGWLKLLGGLGLGALAGGAIAFFLRSREEEPLYVPPPPPAPPRRDDAILLRPAPTPPSAPAAQDDDAPITLKTPSAEEPAAAKEEPAAPAEASAAPAEESAAPAAEASAAEEVMDVPVAEFYPNAVVPTDGQCPASHPVKGNINQNGQLIYHTAGSNNYDRTNAEACFATEADAEAAGFRKSRS